MLNEEALKQVIATVLSVDPVSINSETSMDTVPEWDSLHHITLILALEDEFKVSIPDEDASNITSYPLIKLVMEELLQKKKS